MKTFGHEVKNYWNEYEVIDDYAHVKIKRPVVTLLLDGKQSFAYCKPDDEWNPITGVKIALDNWITLYKHGIWDKAKFWLWFAKHRERILKYRKESKHDIIFDEWKRLSRKESDHVFDALRYATSKEIYPHGWWRYLTTRDTKGE